MRYCLRQGGFVFIGVWLLLSGLHKYYSVHFHNKWIGGTEEAIGFGGNPDHALRYG